MKSPKPSAPVPQETEIADRVRRLDQLHTDGHISDEEHAAKRQTILD